MISIIQPTVIDLAGKKAIYFFSIPFWSKVCNVVTLHPFCSINRCNLSPDGGIGRRARLKILLSKGSAGSIPVLGTWNHRNGGFFRFTTNTISPNSYRFHHHLSFTDCDYHFPEFACLHVYVVSGCSLRNFILYGDKINALQLAVLVQVI
jgi:hypothetical protein